MNAKLFSICFLFGSASFSKGGAAAVDSNTPVRITISDAQIQPSGYITLTVLLRASPFDDVINAFYDGHHYLGGGDYGQGGNGTRTDTVSFNLNPEKKPSRIKIIESSWITRLLIRKGESRDLKKGKPVYFYDFYSGSEIRHYGYIELK